MANIVFPTVEAIANVVPTNGNTVPIVGTRALTNHTEALLYYALCLENIHIGDNINLGNVIVPAMNVGKVSALNGDIYFNVNGFVKMKPSYATFPSGLPLWKQCTERLPNNAADSGFNF